MLTFHFVTEFPEQLTQYLIKGIFERALKKGAFAINTVTLRDFAKGKHKKIDDYPFSDKKGMLLRADVIDNALQSIPNVLDKQLVVACPQGKSFSQSLSRQWVDNKKDMVFISGYYAGIDERLYKQYSIQRVSIGNYILNSGDTAAIAMAETMIRQLPSVLGNSDCAKEDTYSTPFLQAPKYTKPLRFYNSVVPDILRSGNHDAVKMYNLKESLEKTLFNRIELCKKI